MIKEISILNKNRVLGKIILSSDKNYPADDLNGCSGNWFILGNIFVNKLNITKVD